VAFPIVTGAWFNPTSHVPSPILYRKEDGTQVTNFPQSLSLWAGETDIASVDNTKTCHAQRESYQTTSPDSGDSIKKAIRTGESNRREDTFVFECEKKAQF
jgi:hypothetical protein